MSADIAGLVIREIGSASDAAWEGWKRIYYDSFPESERMSEGYFLGVLEQKAAGEAPDAHMLVMLPETAPEPVIGLAYYELDRELRAGFLWYLATRQEDRSRGHGARLYADILRRLRADGAALLLFEVEIPELAEQEDPERAALARRRIDWYRRQGALLLGGIEYFQSVDTGVEPTEMHVMAHLFAPMTAEEVYAIAANLFEDAIRQTGPLTLS